MFITRYKPRTELDRYFNRGWTFPSLFREFLESEADREDEVSPHRLPLTNVTETEDAYVFSMEMPGITKDNVDVSVEGDRLIVKGVSESKSEEKSEEKGFIRREYHSTHFERSFSLGNEVDAERVSAKMRDGVLTVSLSKKKEKVGRKVDVA